MTNMELWLSRLETIKNHVLKMQKKYGECTLFDIDCEECQKIKVINDVIMVKGKRHHNGYDRGWAWVEEWLPFDKNPFIVNGFYHTGSIII